MENTAILKIKFLPRISFFLLIFISSCCLFKTDSPDLRITGQNFPSTANANQTFSISFTIANISSGECDAAATNESSVNLKMVNRATGYLQVNNTYALTSLDNNISRTITATVNIGTAGTYDLTFIVDPNNTAGQSNRLNDTYTATIIIN